MSTYYSYYLFYQPNPDSETLKYCGPYQENQKVASIYTYSGGFDYGFIKDVYTRLIDEDDFDSLGLSPYFEKWSNEDWGGKRQMYLVPYSAVQGQTSIPLHQAYFHIDFLRDSEIRGVQVDDYELSEWFEYGIYSDDEDPGILSVTEYQRLSPEKQKNYVFKAWNNMLDKRVHAHNLYTIASNWFNDNVEFRDGFKDWKERKVWLVVSID